MNNFDKRLDEVLDLFGHAVINYGQTEGSRTSLKAKYAKKIKTLVLEEVIGENEPIGSPLGTVNVTLTLTNDDLTDIGNRLRDAQRWSVNGDIDID